MCGIAGLVMPGLSPEAMAHALQRMGDSLAHRGPDAAGMHVAANLGCGLAHRRLSIIDLSAAGQQPMYSPDRRCVICFNGELYNFQELRHHLEQAGRVFHSRSDTEVALAAYEQWGTGAFARFNGMFALAILDARAATLVLARDQVGIKPLFVAEQGGGFGFASEIKALRASGCFDLAPDYAHLHEYLYFGNTLGRATFYGGVRRLPPGTWLEIDLRTRTIGPVTSYWSANSLAESPRDDQVVHTRNLLDAAVRSQLVSDVPVGVFLSGGVDSTALVALASRHYGGRLRTYSVGFDYTGVAAELPAARRIAAQFGTEHHELHVGGDRITDAIERMVEAHDQPFGDAANLPLFQLCTAVQGVTKVVLQGDGGDELFGGYRRYEYLGWPRPLVALSASLLAWLPAPRLAGGRRFFHALHQRDAARRMGLLLTEEGPFNPPARVLARDVREWVAAQDPFRRYREVIAQLPPENALQGMLRTDLQILLPDIFLEKVDRATMATGTEVRVPFLDVTLIDYVLGLPARDKVRYRQRKRLLRQALRGIVPDRVLDAPKVGFGVPVSAWLAGPLRGYAEDAIACAQRKSPLFDLDEVTSMFHQHAAAQRDFGPLLWKTLQLALWICKTEGALPALAGER